MECDSFEKGNRNMNIPKLKGKMVEKGLIGKLVEVESAEGDIIEVVVE